MDTAPSTAPPQSTANNSRLPPRAFPNKTATSDGINHRVDSEPSLHRSRRGDQPTRQRGKADAPQPNDIHPTSSRPLPPGQPHLQKRESNHQAAFPHKSSDQAPRPQPSRRRYAPKFNANLTEQTEKPSVNTKKPNHSRKHNDSNHQDDLTSRLIHGFRTHPYPDCAICFNSIRPAEPTWSCSPLGVDISDSTGSQCCWTTFHFKCVRSWAAKSVKEISEALQARGEVRESEWLCPACRSKRVSVPSGYKCFCGSAIDPKPPRLATPHSCGNPCSRPRNCGHPCSIACHPGPCPPCQVTTRLECHCKSKVVSFKCSHLSSTKHNDAPTADPSCGNTCSKTLECGNHKCEDICHPGSCRPCDIKEKAQCYCGKEEAHISCGKGDPQECEAESGSKWLGVYACDNVCARPFDCGLHYCSKSCHPPSKVAAICPLSPTVVNSCPCGKYKLASSETSSFPPGSKLTRTSCTDPVPTCTSLCMKSLPDCLHVCSVPCHTGPCPPCTIRIVRPCRCGATTRDVECHEDQGGFLHKVLCDRPCAALRACGKHQCNRVCCPLAPPAGGVKGKGKKRAMEDVLIDDQGLHTCDLVCGRPLTCGNHHCEEKDHKGPCPPCLRSSFEEIFCHCSKTILEPPVACGTRISCVYPCDRAPPLCGHPRSPHHCHEDPVPCPPCPFLTSKLCGCGKKSVNNVKCSQEKVSCGTACGKLMTCGFHRCERLCHSDDCGTCHSPCEKLRKLCLPAHHPCPEACHAPSVCPEIEPCRAIIDNTCPCGRIRRPVPCGKSISHPSGREDLEKVICTNECSVAKRSLMLAEALGISMENRIDMRKAHYSDGLLAFAQANPKFCFSTEKRLADFVSSNKKSQVLAHVPEASRQFIKQLCVIYRIDTFVVEQESRGSFQLIRRIDSRIPSPLLSNAAKLLHSGTSPANTSGLKEPVNLRTQIRQSPSQLVPKAAASAPAITSNRIPASITSRSETVVTTDPWSDSLRSRTVPTSEGDRGSTNMPAITPANTSPVPENWEDD